MEPREEKKLDHASARIVAELSAQLLPPLREALSELRSQERGERDEAWRTIREAVDALAARPQPEPPPENSERWEALSRSSEETTRRIAALEERLERFEALLRDFLTPPPPIPCEPPPESEPETAPVREGPLSELLENRIPAWEGLLRAHSRAQSQELNALSTELAELQNETRSTLNRTLQETLAQELAAFVAQDDPRLASLREALRVEAHAVRHWLWGVLSLAALTLLAVIALG